MPRIAGEREREREGGIYFIIVSTLVQLFITSRFRED